MISTVLWDFTVSAQVVGLIFAYRANRSWRRTAREYEVLHANSHREAQSLRHEVARQQQEINLYREAFSRAGYTFGAVEKPAPKKKCTRKKKKKQPTHVRRIRNSTLDKE